MTWGRVRTPKGLNRQLKSDMTQGDETYFNNNCIIFDKLVNFSMIKKKHCWQETYFCHWVTEG